MNFMATIKDRYQEKVTPLVLERAAVRTQISAMEKRIEAESEAAGRAHSDAGRLKLLIGKSLAEGTKAFEQLEASLQECLTAHKRCLERVSAIQELLPSKKQELADLHIKVENARRSLAASMCPVAQAELEKHLQPLIDVFDSWVTVWMQLAREDGDGFSLTLDVLPSLKGDRIDRSRPSIIVPRKPEEYAARLPKQVQEPQEAE